MCSPIAVVAFSGDSMIVIPPEAAGGAVHADPPPLAPDAGQAALVERSGAEGNAAAVPRTTILDGVPEEPVPVVPRSWVPLAWSNPVCWGICPPVGEEPPRDIVTAGAPASPSTMVISVGGVAAGSGCWSESAERAATSSSWSVEGDWSASVEEDPEATPPNASLTIQPRHSAAAPSRTWTNHFGTYTGHRPHGDRGSRESGRTQGPVASVGHPGGTPGGPPGRSTVVCR